jgi:D-3-phosphoglycerate dehydrogenase
MRILIADKLASEGPDWLKAQPGVEVAVQTGLTGEALARAIAASDGVVVRSETRITAPVIEQAMAGGEARLRAIARAGVGVDNIDLDAATRFGIAVMNSASASTITTAEHAFALMIALARNIAHAHMTMTSGGWDRTKFTGTQLHGKTLGIVGFGRIGQTLARRAIAFGMNVIAFDPLINASDALDGQVRLVRSFDELIPQVDIVSFHVPATDDTLGMLGREQFARARKGLLVINAARGGVVDESALLEALESGQCGGAALDVFATEPPAKDSPLRNHPRIVTTPHLGASTVEAQEAVALDACRALLTYLRGEGFPGAVNAGGLAFDLSQRQRAFVDLAGRMIALLDAATAAQRVSSARFILRGESLAGRAETIARMALAELLRRRLDQPVNLINAAMIAEQRRIGFETIIASESGDDRLAIELSEGGTDDEPRLVEGAIYADDLPRITLLDGYRMDMVPAGQMVLITNNDQPGRIGLVGKLFGDAGVNIAEMVIGRKAMATSNAGGTRGQVAMMILKLDDQPPPELIQSLRGSAGILSVASVSLPGVMISS